MFVRFCTQSVFEAPRHHGVVSAEDAQGVVFRMFQQQAQTEAVVTLVVGGDRQLRGRKKKKKKHLRHPFHFCLGLLIFRGLMQHKDVCTPG